MNARGPTQPRRCPIRTFIGVLCGVIIGAAGSALAGPGFLPADQPIGTVTPAPGGTFVETINAHDLPAACSSGTVDIDISRTGGTGYNGVQMVSASIVCSDVLTIRHLNGSTERVRITGLKVN